MRIQVQTIKKLFQILLATMCAMTMATAVEAASSKKSNKNPLMISSVEINSSGSGVCSGEESLTIIGMNFDNGDDPMVFLGNQGELDVCDSTEFVIDVLCPLDGTEHFCPAGDFRLEVSTNKPNKNSGKSNKSNNKYDAYDLTIGGGGGTQGPAGPEGPQGPVGPASEIAGPTGPAGLACWDLNGNGIKDLAEDVDGISGVDVFDCKGEQGTAGLDGANCWDDVGDVTGDGFTDLDDCLSSGGEGEEGGGFKSFTASIEIEVNVLSDPPGFFQEEINCTSFDESAGPVLGGGYNFPTGSNVDIYASSPLEGDDNTWYFTGIYQGPEETELLTFWVKCFGDPPPEA